MYCTFNLTVVPLRQQCRTKVNALRCGWGETDRTLY